MSRVSAVSLLARRFLLSKNSDGFVSLIAWVSVLGVALGVLALIVVTSVINGFENELSRVITGLNGEVLLYSRGEPLTDPKGIEKRIRKAVPEVTDITSSLVTELMVSGPVGVAGAVLEGIDAETVGDVTAIKRRLIEGRLPFPGAESQGVVEVTLGSAIAERIGAEEGSEVRLIIPFAGPYSGSDEGGALNTLPKAIKAKVVGKVRMGMYEYDSKFVFASLAAVQSILEQPGKVSSFKLKLKRGADTRVASDRLSEHFGYPFRAKDWGQLNKNLFAAIQYQKRVISIILTAIVIVAAFNIVSTLTMMIHDKTREISILKTMGFMPGQGFRLFCVIGLGMGIVGTVIGIGLGLGANRIIERFRIVDLPADVYYIGFLPVVTRWVEVGMIAACAVLISFLATLYPAWRVAKRSPLDGLRYE